jgi:thiamine biosynthesis lipoprotein
VVIAAPAGLSPAPPAAVPEPALRQGADGIWRGRFEAMASPCELLVDGGSRSEALALTAAAHAEALRIQQRYSRYRSDSVVAQLLAGRGAWQAVDDETAQWLDFAAQCHALSGGLFDVTSGVLRQAWHFDGGSRVPTAAAVAALLPLVGWHRLRWERPRLLLPAGMELDFGGIGKEIAVDRVLQLTRAATPHPVLVNFGGDLACSGPRADGSAWQVGLERPGAPQHAAAVLALAGGALATSGDARRFVLHRGRRLGHVPDPRTGWPVRSAPRSVTVAAASCVEAGMLATMALLQGAAAGRWLQRSGAPHALVTAEGRVQSTMPAARPPPPVPPVA